MVFAVNDVVLFFCADESDHLTDRFMVVNQERARTVFAKATEVLETTFLTVVCMLHW